MLKLGVHTSDRFCPQKGKALTVQLPVARGFTTSHYGNPKKKTERERGNTPKTSHYSGYGMVWLLVWAQKDAPPGVGPSCTAEILNFY
jgi:hypothetical protein